MICDIFTSLREKWFFIALLRVYDVNLVGFRLGQVGATLFTLHQIGPTGFKLSIYICGERKFYTCTRAYIHIKYHLYILHLYSIVLCNSVCNIFFLSFALLGDLSYNYC